MDQFGIEADDSDELDIATFADIVRSHWHYQEMCNMLNWSLFKRDDEVWQFEIAPPYQIVYGGADDGKIVWSPFEFEVGAFLNEPDISAVVECGVMTYSSREATGPFIGIVASFRGKPFALRIHLEPVADTRPLEIIDRIKNEVRAIEND